MEGRGQQQQREKEPCADCPGTEDEHDAVGPSLEGVSNAMQNNQHGCLYSRGTTERQDKAHGAPDAEADEYERNEDQLLICRGSGGASLQLAPLADGPVLRERLVRPVDVLSDQKVQQR